VIVLVESLVKSLQGHSMLQTSNQLGQKGHQNEAPNHGNKTRQAQPAESESSSNYEWKRGMFVSTTEMVAEKGK
jgi:hypothetical protein